MSAARAAFRRVAAAARRRSSDARRRSLPRRRTRRPRTAPHRRAAGSRGPTSGPQDRELVEALVEDFLRVDLEVPFEDLLIDGAEVDVVCEVATGVELGKARRGAVEPEIGRASCR